TPLAQPTGLAGQVLYLQRRVGNRAVQRLLQTPTRVARRAGLLVQRWGGDEHYEIGPAAGVQVAPRKGAGRDSAAIGGVVDDEVGWTEERLELTKTESGKARLRAALEHGEIAGNGVKTLPAPFDDEKDAQAVEFYTLLLDNVTHFQSQGKALDTYRGYHTKALNAAAAAGLEHPDDTSADLNSAYLQEAFGQHFLTDVCSCGHAITPRSEIYDHYVDVWAPKMVDAIIGNLKARLVQGIYEQVAAQSGAADIFPERVKASIESALNDMLNDAVGKLQGG